MIYEPRTQMPAVSFHRVRDDAAWLRALLQERQIDIDPASELGHALRLALRLPELSDPQNAPPDFDPRLLAGPVGLGYLARGLKLASTSRWFRSLDRLLPHLAGSKAAPLEMIDASQSFERDMVFELLMSAILMGMYEHVESASEPDIFVDERDATWDIACKLVYSQTSVTLNDQVEKGISQVRRFGGSYGLVFVGLTNRIDQSLFLPLLSSMENRWGTFPSGDAAYAKIKSVHAQNHNAILAEREVRFLASRADSKFRAIITVLQTMAAIGPAPTIITSLGYIPRAELFDELVIGPEEAFAHKLHERMQDLFAA